jgi:hypothetical protein
VVSAAGVFVIDAKQYTGQLEVRNKGSMFRPDERLYVAGRDRTNLADGVLTQVAAVRRVLEADWPDVTVHGVLCFVGCTWTRFTVKNVNGVVALWPKALAGHVTTDGPHATNIETIATHLRKSLKQPR